VVIIISGKHIRELREKIGISQTELADRVGVTQAHIAKIEAEKVDARLSTINKILNVLESNRSQTKCKAVMSKNILFASPEDKIMKTIQVMRRHNISQLPVIEKGISVGSIKESTIIKNLDKDLQNKKIKDVMEDSFPVVNSNDAVEVAKALLDFHSAVLVAEKGKIVGIITKSDILKLIR
jgi:predicted transcriptional regulator